MSDIMAGAEEMFKGCCCLLVLFFIGILIIGIGIGAAIATGKW